MLSSTRATARSITTATARATSSLAQALPAESSRQGLLRAIAQQQEQQEQQQQHRQRLQVKEYNNLLRQKSRVNGLEGLEDTLKHFRNSGVKPDDTTVQIVLDCVKTTTTSDPTQLATLLNALLRHSPDLQPSPDHLDFLLGQAVRARSRDSHLSRTRIGNNIGNSKSNDNAPSTPTSVDILESPAEIKSDNAQAGLRPSDPFKKAIQGIIQSLQARGARSAAKSLANRLRFEAQAHTSAGAATGPGGTGSLISAQTVWNDMISRGYKPDKRHLLALMKGYAESGHMSECEDVILLAKDIGIEVTRGMWMVLMTAYGRRGDQFDLNRAEKAFQAIKRSEQGLDPAAVCAMIGIYLRARKRHLASHLALQLVGNLVMDPPQPQPQTANSNPTQTANTSSIFNSSLSPSYLSSTSSSRNEIATSTSADWTIPPFPRSALNDRVIAIATDALRLDHPLCALEVISTAYINPHPTPLPTRVRQVVKSIKSRSRSRIKWNVADAADSELLIQADRILSLADHRSNLKDTGSVPTLTSTAENLGQKVPGVGVGKRIGPAGVKKRLLRLFERKGHNHKRRGSGGRKVISAKEEKRVRHEMISKKQV